MPVFHALDWLADAAGGDVPPVCVMFGDEPFLKRLALAQLRRAVLGDDDGRFSLARFEGDSVETRDVFDELATRALFGGGRRLVVVLEADEFVSRNRPALEKYVARPKASGVLVLDVESWPTNTRLYKAVAAAGLAVECKVPTTARLVKWLATWARTGYNARLDRDAAELLLEIVGPRLGLVDQELAKLAAAAGARGQIGAELVQELVGGWRAKTTWDMLDLAAAGNAPQALVELDRLLLAGESPVAILGQIGSTLRRFAAATRLIQEAESSGRRMSLRQALEGAGIRPVPFILNKAEAQLRQIGRQRAGQLYRWVLEADLALKGQSSSPARARLVLEELIAKLSAAAGPQPLPRQAASLR